VQRRIRRASGRDRYLETLDLDWVVAVTVCTPAGRSAAVALFRTAALP
jgi:hypothetical protein